jgi:hypothetical protein
MAYVTPQDPSATDPNQVALDAPVQLATQAPAAVGSTFDPGNIMMTPYSSGDGTATPVTASVNAPNVPSSPVAEPTSTPKATSGTFTNLNSYLNANQSGAQAVGGRVANKISSDVGSANDAVSSASNDYRNQIASNTNAASSDYLNSAYSAPSNYLNDTTFAKDLSGTYAGPSSFANTAGSTTAQAALANAQQTAQLAGTSGGRTQLINQTAAAPLTNGGANLDQWLVQGNQPAFSTVTNAAASATPLQSTYDTAVSSGDAAAQAAAKGNADLRTQILQGLTTGQSAYNNNLKTQAADTAAKMNANNDAVAQFLKTGQGDVGTVLPQLGMTPQALAGLQAANDAAKAKGLPGVDLSQFWSGAQSPNFDIGNVATSNDLANLNAYAHFLGTSNPTVNAGAITPGSFDFVNAGQRIADMIKSGNATTGSNATPVTKAPGVGANTVGGYVGNVNTGGQGSSSGGGSGGSGGSSSSSGGTYNPGYSVGDDGIAHMDNTGLSDAQAKALGTLATVLTGIPALGTLGSYINSSINNANFAAAQQYNNAESLANAKEAQATLGAYGGYTTGSDNNVGSQANTDATRAAANNVTQSADQATSAASPTATYASQDAANQARNDALAAERAANETAVQQAIAASAQQATDQQTVAQQQAQYAAQLTAQIQAQQQAQAQAVAAQQAQAQAVAAQQAQQAAAENAANEAATAAAQASANAGGSDARTTTVGGNSYTTSGYGADGMGPPSSAIGQGGGGNTSSGGESSGGGWGGGAGGECVSPNTQILLADGTSKQAGLLEVGDMLHTMHEDTLEYGDYPVSAISTVIQPRYEVLFDDDHKMVVSFSHKFLSNGWTPMYELESGSKVELHGGKFKSIVSKTDIGPGDVIKMTVQDAHTYISEGILSHNKRDGGIVHGPGTGTSDSIPLMLSNGEYVLKASAVKALGREFLDKLNNIAK